MACNKLLRSVLRTRFMQKSVPKRLLSSLRPGAELDTSYLCDVNRVNEIEENIKKRNAHGDIHLVQKLFQDYQKCKSDKAWNQFAAEALKIPNRTLEHREENKKIKVCLLKAYVLPVMN